MALQAQMVTLHHHWKCSIAPRLGIFMFVSSKMSNDNCVPMTNRGVEKEKERTCLDWQLPVFTGQIASCWRAYISPILA